MATKLYVGNLSYGTTEDDLREMFAKAGTVESVALPMDRESNRPRGFGFVEMSSPEEARKAISMLDGQTVGNRQIKVNEAKPQQPRSGGQGGYGGSRGRSRF